VCGCDKDAGRPQIPQMYAPGQVRSVLSRRSVIDNARQHVDCERISGRLASGHLSSVWRANSRGTERRTIVYRETRHTGRAPRPVEPSDDTRNGLG
jgi:hypothetical protein